MGLTREVREGTVEVVEAGGGADVEPGAGVELAVQLVPEHGSEQQRAQRQRRLGVASE